MIPFMEFLGVKTHKQLKHHHTRHLMMPLEVLWADKAKPGGKAEQTKKDIISQHPEEEHAGILAKLGGFAQEVYKDVRSVKKKVEKEFDERTGADPKDWANLDSEVEMIVIWKPFHLGTKWEKPINPYEFEASEKPVSCLLFVGVVMCHQLPTK